MGQSGYNVTDTRFVAYQTSYLQSLLFGGASGVDWRGAARVSSDAAFWKRVRQHGGQFPPSINVQLPGCHTPRHPDEPDWDGGGLFIVVMAAVGHGLFFFEHGSGTLHWFLLEEGDIMCFTGVVRYEYTHGVVNLQARGIRMTLTNRYGEDAESDRVAFIKRVQWCA